MERLKGKVAIITGGGSGIGKETAELFAREGATVAICGRTLSKLSETVINIQNAGGKAKAYPLDVCNPVQVAEVFAQIDQDWGKIDILVNGSGIVGPSGLPDEISVEDWYKVMDTDCNGTFITCREVIQYMRKQGKGSIVNLASISGKKSECPGVTPYHVAKAAVIMITKNFAVSYAKENIRCNCVCPGTTLTGMVQEDLINKFGSVEAGEPVYAAMHPMGRLGKPHETAYAILYLASDEASWTTGADLSVDGGFSAC